MLVRLLRAAYKRPLVALAFVLVLALLLGVAGVRLAMVNESPDESPREHSGVTMRLLHGDAIPHGDAKVEPREILNRGWFDRLPEKNKDKYELWVFFAGGIGVHEQGSRFEGKYEIIDFERQGQKLEIRFLQSGQKRSVPFLLRRCDDTPPFSLCLTLKNLPGGDKQLYGFAYDEELDRALPWGKAKLGAAKAQSGSR